MPELDLEKRFNNIEARLHQLLSNQQSSSFDQILSQSVGGDKRRSVVAVFCGYKHFKRWDRSDWTGDVTWYLKIPEDATTEPSYISKAEFDAATDADVFDVVDLIRTQGPYYYTRDDGWKDGWIRWQESITVPDGWVVCDGGNGSTDLRGRTLFGYKSEDADFGTIGAEVGAKDHSHATHAQHDVSGHSHADHSTTGHYHTVAVTLAWDGNGMGSAQYVSAVDGNTGTVGGEYLSHDTSGGQSLEHDEHSTEKNISPGVVGVWVMRKRGFVHT